MSSFHLRRVSHLKRWTFFVFLFIAAIFDATAQMPPVRELQACPPPALSLATRTSPPLSPRPLRRAVCADGCARRPLCSQALALLCAPVPVRCACAHEQEVLMLLWNPTPNPDPNPNPNANANPNPNPNPKPSCR